MTTKRRKPGAFGLSRSGLGHSATSRFSRLQRVPGDYNSGYTNALAHGPNGQLCRGAHSTNLPRSPFRGVEPEARLMASDPPSWLADCSTGSPDTAAVPQGFGKEN